MENEWMGSFKSTEVWPSRSNRAIVLAKQIVILYLMGGNRLEKVVVGVTGLPRPARDQPRGAEMCENVISFGIKSSCLVVLPYAVSALHCDPLA